MGGTTASAHKFEKGEKMRIRSTFHTFVLMATLLTFSMSSVTLAQQNSLKVEARAAAEPDAKLISLEVKATAERDAGRDINKPLWFGAGMGIGILGTTVGTLAGCAVGSIIDPPSSSGLFYFETSTGQDVGTLIGAAAGCLLPLVGIYSYKGHPPTERLIGKSPEYVELYTDAYTAKSRSIRIKSAAGGVATGCGLSIIGFLMLPSL